LIDWLIKFIDCINVNGNKDNTVLLNNADNRTMKQDTLYKNHVNACNKDNTVLLYNADNSLGRRRIHYTSISYDTPLQ